MKIIYKLEVYMKNILTILTIISIIFLVGCNQNHLEISSINVEVQLQNDGSALITEIWQTSNLNSGTEFFRVMGMHEGMQIHSLQISDDTGVIYETITDWDIDATFEEKAYRAGILHNNGKTEIVWGMTRSGANTYTINYTLDGLVQRFADTDGFRHYFISDGLSPYPHTISILISKQGVDLTHQNTNLNFLGVDGNIITTDEGAFLFENTSPDTRTGVSVVANFSQELFEPTIEHDLYFEEMLAQNNFDWWMFSVVFIAISLVLYLLIIINKFFLQRIKLNDGTIKKIPKLKELPINYDFPFNENFVATFNVLKRHILTPNGYILGHPFEVYLMKLQQLGLVEIEEIEKDEGYAKLQIIESSSQLPPILNSLHDILLSKADEKGRISTDQEDRWEELGECIEEWKKELQLIGEHELLDTAILTHDSKGKIRYTHHGATRFSISA